MSHVFYKYAAPYVFGYNEFKSLFSYSRDAKRRLNPQTMCSLFVDKHSVGQVRWAHIQFVQSQVKQDKKVRETHQGNLTVAFIRTIVHTMLTLAALYGAIQFIGLRYLMLTENFGNSRLLRSWLLGGLRDDFLMLVVGFALFLLCLYWLLLHPLRNGYFGFRDEYHWHASAGLIQSLNIKRAGSVTWRPADQPESVAYRV